MPPLASPWLHLDRIAARIGETQSLAIATDFDGTLAPIADHPDVVMLDERMRDALATLASYEGIHVGVFSGRPLAELVERVGLPGIWLSGVSGLEARDEQGRTRVPDSLPEGVPDVLRRSLAEWCERHPGAWLQDKGLAFAVHYRALPVRVQMAFAAGVRRRAAPFRHRTRLLPGKKVFELLPIAAADKAWALTTWLPEGALPFYFGDDVNDEPAYPFVRERGGVTIAVGRISSRAEFGVGSPRHVAWFLEWLAREWRVSRGAVSLSESEPVSA